MRPASLGRRSSRRSRTSLTLMGCGASQPGAPAPEDSFPDSSKPPAEASPAEKTPGGKECPTAAPTPAPSKEELRDSKIYHDITGLREFLSSGSVALLKASYLLVLASIPGAVLPRRQDLPPSALVDVEMLDRCLGELSRCDAETRCDEKFLPLIILSYCWMAKEHPDGEGRQLREVIAPALEWYMSERAGRIANRWCQGSCADPSAAEGLTAEAVDFACFIVRLPIPQSSVSHRASPSLLR